MHVLDTGEAALQRREDRGLAGDRPQQQMLKATADDHMKNRIAPVRHRIDLHDVPLGPLPVILRELSEWPFGLADLWQEAALDHNLCVRRNAHAVRQALDHVEGLARERPGDLQLVVAEGHDGLGGEEAGGIDADHEGDFEAPALGLSLAIEIVGMPGQNQHADPVRTADLAAQDGDVLQAGLRVPGDHQARRDVGAAVVLVQSRHRQELQDVESLPVDDLLRGAELRSCQGSGWAAACWKWATRRSCVVPRASAIQARLDTRPETMVPGCPPGCGNRLACRPSRRFATAAASWRKPIPGRAMARRPSPDSRSSQSRRERTGAGAFMLSSRRGLLNQACQGGSVKLFPQAGKITIGDAAHQPV